MIILLDFGHETTTVGKQSPDGSFKEWSFNRDLGMRIYCGLRRYGVDVRIINPETSLVTLTERARRANEICLQYGKENVLFVSIHANAAGNGTQWMNARGWSVFVAKSCSQASKNLATYLATQAQEEGFKVRQPMPSQKYWQENFTVLTKTSCPAVLTENLFYDNMSDLELLKSEDVKDKLADVHVKGICKYLGINMCNCCCGC